jgi:long-chain fatty acid transport protein
MKPFKLCAMAAACLLAGPVFGAGFQLYTEGSAEALGQAGAISGRDDLTSLAWYNPSALAGTDRSAVMAGAILASIHTDFETPVPGANASMSDDWQAIPHFYFVNPVTDSWTALLSVNAPYGLITEWPSGWVGNQLATRSELKTIYVTPSVAYRINETFSVSLGANAVIADAELIAATNVVVPGVGPVGATRTLSGDDLGYGFTASAHCNVAEGWALGARYQSRVAMTLEGVVSIDGMLAPGMPFSQAVGAEADLTLPSTFNIGLANTSIENLAIGLDLVWSEWSAYDQLAVVTPLGTSKAPKNWKDVWSLRLGGEYTLKESWKLRTGYVFDQSPVPDTTRSPELPGSDRQMLMAGLGWKSGGFGLDLAYSYLWAEKAAMGTIYPLPGQFETTTHLVALSASYAF